MPQSCGSVDQFGFGSWRSWSDRVNAVANGLDRVSCDYGGLLLPVHQDDPRSVPRVAASCAALEGWGRRFISLSTSVQSARAPRTIISVTSTDMTVSLCFRSRSEMSGLFEGQDVSGSGLRPLAAAATLPDLSARAKYLLDSANVGEPQGSPRSRCSRAGSCCACRRQDPFHGQG